METVKFIIVPYPRTGDIKRPVTLSSPAPRHDNTVHLQRRPSASDTHGTHATDTTVWCQPA